MLMPHAAETNSLSQLGRIDNGARSESDCIYAELPESLMLAHDVHCKLQTACKAAAVTLTTHI